MDADDRGYRAGAAADLAGGALGDEADRLTALPVWIPCPCCQDYWCTIHGRHAYECECPDIAEWTVDPYRNSECQDVC